MVLNDILWLPRPLKLVVVIAAAVAAAVVTKMNRVTLDFLQAWDWHYPSAASGGVTIEVGWQLLI